MHPLRSKTGGGSIAQMGRELVNSFRTMFAFASLLLTLVPLHGYAANPESRLARMLSGSNEVVRLKTIASLRAMPERCIAALPELISVVKAEASEAKVNESIRPSAVQLIDLLGSIHRPEVEQALAELLDAAHPSIAIVAANTLGENQFTGAIEALKRQADRPEFPLSYGFRFNLVRAFALMKHPDAIEFITALRPNVDGQLSFEIEKQLANVKEFDFQDDPKRFEAWQKSRESKKISLVSGGSESEARERLALGQSKQYYGIDIEAKRMMFIIDNSGSMNEVEAGMTRLHRAKYELTRAIELLPNDAEFAIVFYSTAVHPWKHKLVTATAENKREAIVFIDRLGYGNRTNTYGALRQSIEFDSNLEAVFLLTDGRPTIGDIVLPQAIVDDIMHRNRFRHLNFNTIGISLDNATDQFLKTIAEMSGGEFRKAG